MQPRNLPEADVLAEVPGDPFAAGALDVLLPHAASSKLAAAAAADTNAVYFTVSSSAPGCRIPGVSGLPLGPDSPKAKT
jgi:hypothetical protein